MDQGLLIGDVAARSGLSRKALRLYEARGILSSARRTPSGYRRYPTDVLGLLAFVGQARRPGLTLAEIRHIVDLRRAGYAPCGHVRELLQQKAAGSACSAHGSCRGSTCSWTPATRRGPRPSSWLSTACSLERSIAARVRSPTGERPLRISSPATRGSTRLAVWTATASRPAAPRL
jgi:DNA-binding transcriptional MerR regulator